MSAIKSLPVYLELLSRMSLEELQSIMLCTGYSATAAEERCENSITGWIKIWKFTGDLNLQFIANSI
jgi:hypothetical protein